MSFSELTNPKLYLKELKNSPEWTEEEKKIIAWSLCWEGSISLRKGKCDTSIQGYALRPVLSLSNTDFKLLDEFYKIIKLGKISHKYRPNKPAHKPMKVWKCTSLEEVLFVLSQIKRYLPSKIERAECVIQFCLSRLSHKKGMTLRHLYTDFEISMYEKSRELNKRGVGL